MSPKYRAVEAQGRCVTRVFTYDGFFCIYVVYLSWIWAYGDSRPATCLADRVVEAGARLDCLSMMYISFFFFLIFDVSVMDFMEILGVSSLLLIAPERPRAGA